LVIVFASVSGLAVGFLLSDQVAKRSGQRISHTVVATAVESRADRDPNRSPAPADIG